MDKKWFNGWWSPLQLPLLIAYKELFPVLLAAHVWGSRWSRRRILFPVDNEAVVHILNSQTSKDPDIMHLLLTLLNVAACLIFTFAAVHVPWKANGIAVCLSRFNLRGFRSQALCQEASSPNFSTAFSSAFHSDLEVRCFSFKYQGLAASTRRTSSSALQTFINFCVMIRYVNSSSSPYSATEWTLCLFATFLADSLRHTSIKVYLSAVWSLHVDQRFPDPLENCLRLQRVVRGIKRSQGSLPANSRLPISSNIPRLWTSSHLMIICFELPGY